MQGVNVFSWLLDFMDLQDKYMFFFDIHLIFNRLSPGFRKLPVAAQSGSSWTGGTGNLRSNFQLPVFIHQPGSFQFLRKPESED
jgi:hypothetical protein